MYIIFTEYSVYLHKKEMNTVALLSKKRKNIDLSEETFRALSIMAAANGKNLKAYIETILDNEAGMLLEEAVYREFLQKPDAQEIISGEEKETFEAWLGL